MLNNMNIFKSILAHKLLIKIRPIYFWTALGLIIAGSLVSYLVFKPQIISKPQVEEPETKIVPETEKQGLYARRQKWLEVLKEYPEYYEAFLDLGNIEARLGRFQTALDYYQKAHEVVDTSSIPLLNASEVYLDMKDLAGAEKALLQAVEISPDYPLAYIKLADFYDKYRSDVDKAVEAYRLGVTNAPDKSGLLAELGNYLANRNRLVEALQAYQEYLQIDPSNTQVQTRIKDLQSKLGR